MNIHGKEILIQAHQVSTQKDAVKCHLKDFETITSMTAFNDYGITRLSSIIHSLRREGYNITSVPMTRVNRYNNSVTFSKYKYIKPQTNGNS